jgi:hypothetical protein
MKRFGICVWCSETPDEFELSWASIIADYGLGNNVWLNDKYALRESWIPAYFVGYSLGGILRTTSRSESENAFFGRFVNRRLALLESWIRFEAALEEQREKELYDDIMTTPRFIHHLYSRHLGASRSMLGRSTHIPYLRSFSKRWSLRGIIVWCKVWNRLERKRSPELGIVEAG